MRNPDPVFHIPDPNQTGSVPIYPNPKIKFNIN